MALESGFFFHLILNVIVASFLAIVSGLIMNILIPFPKFEEPIWKTVIWLFIQLTMSAAILLLYTDWYVKITQQRPDIFLFATIFGLVFYLCQSSILGRLRLLSKNITGIDIARNVRDDN